MTGETKERTKLQWEDSKANKTRAPIKASLPVGDDLEMDIEYREITGAKVEELELKARRESMRGGVIDEVAREKVLSQMLWEEVMVSFLGQPWSETVRRQIKSREYQVLSTFIKELVAGK